MANKPSRSKPVIQPGHKQIIVKDDSLDQAAEESPKDDTIPMQTHAITLTPSPELLKQVNDEEDAKDKPSEPEQTVQSDRTDAGPDKPEPDKTDRIQADVVEDDQAKSSDDSESKDKTDTETVDDQHAREIDQIVESGRYFLPINRVEKRHNRKMVLFGLVICVVLMAAWLDIALDAGLLPNTYNLPHTHFFIVRP